VIRREASGERWRESQALPPWRRHIPGRPGRVSQVRHMHADLVGASCFYLYLNEGRFLEAFLDLEERNGLARRCRVDADLFRSFTCLPMAALMVPEPFLITPLTSAIYFFCTMRFLNCAVSALSACSVLATTMTPKCPCRGGERCPPAPVRSLRLPRSPSR